MRKILVAFFISIYFLSGLFGFGVVRQVRALAKSEPTPLTPATQVNLILVHVDDLKLDRPGLTSIWGVFINHSVFPSLIMKRIYPEAGSPASAKLASAFSLDQHKQLEPKFLDVMQDLDMPAAEIILVDGVGIADIAATLSHQGTSGRTGAQPPAPQKLDLAFFQDICTAIDAPTSTVPFFSTGQTPVGTSSEVEDSFGFLNKWKGLVTSLHFASCEVLAGP